MITKEQKTQALAAGSRHKTDVGSPEAQAALLTERIKQVTEHLKQNKHDNPARRGLLQMVGQRKKLLAYLQRKDFAAYKLLIEKLGLRK